MGGMDELRKQADSLRKERFASAAQMVEAIAALIGGEPGYGQHVENLHELQLDLETDAA